MQTFSLIIPKQKVKATGLINTNYKITHLKYSWPNNIEDHPRIKENYALNL